ncbi:MAG: ABC transporter permease [Oscillospiraceae bacterium]
MKRVLLNLKKHKFLFEELVKRDFNSKYKGTSLGIVWSLLSPLLSLLVMSLVFTQFFGRNTAHYTIYLFAGNLVYSYFRDSTTNGMVSLTANAGIITKVNIPKYLFLLSKNISCLFNFLLTLVIFFVFVIIDGVSFSWSILMIIYPILCLVVFNLGVGMILSALYVFFKDIKYLYDIFTLLLQYMSAIFYTVDAYPPQIQNLFMLNPIYSYISYIRIAVINGQVPSLIHHIICAAYALLFLVIGCVIYKKNNYKFLYYM